MLGMFNSLINIKIKRADETKEHTAEKKTKFAKMATMDDSVTGFMQVTILLSFFQAFWSMKP